MNKTHGESKTREYATWKDIKKRCYNQKSILYKDYGGRGIKLHVRWHKYENFKKDMGVKPKGYSIDRIDNDGDYAPDNCRWATTKEQSLNKRNNRRLKHNGEIKTIQEWGVISAVKPQTFRSRIDMGWPMDRALSLEVS